MKAKKLEQDFEGRLQAASVSFKDEVNKLKKEIESRIAKLLKACKTIDGLDGKLKKVQQKNKDIDEELPWEKNMWELAILKLTDELKKVKEELQKAEKG